MKKRKIYTLKSLKWNSDKAASPLGMFQIVPIVLSPSNIVYNLELHANIGNGVLLLAANKSLDNCKKIAAEEYRTQMLKFLGCARELKCERQHVTSYLN